MCRGAGKGAMRRTKAADAAAAVSVSPAARAGAQPTQQPAARARAAAGEAPSSLVALLRARVAPAVRAAAVRGTPLVSVVQGRCLHPWLSAVLRVNALAISEEFYVTALPLAMWVGRWRWAGHALALQAISLSLGNACKDTVGSPRPWQVAPGRVRAIEQGGMTPVMDEYGFPSTHTWNGLNLAWSLATLLCQELGVQPALSFSLAALWVASVLFSRVYMGAHTLVDLVGGFVLGACTLAVVNSLWGATLQLLWALPWACSALVAAGVVLWLDFVHPLPPAPTPSKKYARSLAATAAGVAVGFARAARERHLRAWLDASLSPLNPVAGARFFLGLAMAVATKESVKVALGAMGVAGNKAQKGAAEPRAAVVSRYAQYAAMGWCIAEGAPAVLIRLGL